MKVSIDFSEDELTPLVQRHLDEGIAVSCEIRRAVRLYLRLLKEEKSGKACGFGDAARFRSYNTVVEVEKA